jgi:hypothetical protein
MPKSGQTSAPKAAERPARKTGRKSAKPTKPQRPKTGRESAKPAKPQRPATKAASSRAPKMRSPATSGRPSKKAAIVALLERPNGAGIGDLAAATGWQQHSVRAALTGLRKEGKELVRDKDAAGVTHYRLAAA